MHRCQMIWANQVRSPCCADQMPGSIAFLRLSKAQRGARRAGNSQETQTHRLPETKDIQHLFYGNDLFNQISGFHILLPLVTFFFNFDVQRAYPKALAEAG